jgi:IclR family acetate operon transcriptional repressor
VRKVLIKDVAVRVEILDSQGKTSSTVIRAFAILDILAARGESGASLKEVSGDLGVSKSTAHRHLTTLENLTVVERDDKDHFHLGLKLVELAGALLSEYNLRNVSEPFLNEVAVRTKETVHLAVPSQDEVVYIAKVDSPHSVRMASRIGARMPMYCTSLGKAVLAHCPFEQGEKIIQDGMPARTKYTITSRRALYAELERVREQGFATDDQENEMGVRCVGAPIFDYDNRIIGAISVSGPASRFTKEQCLKFGPLVRETALGVSRRMGYPY